MNQWLLEIVQCPLCQEPLIQAEPSLVEALLVQFREHKLTNQLGIPIDDEFEAGLVNQSRTYFYPVRGGIPTLIAEEAITIQSSLARAR